MKNFNRYYTLFSLCGLNCGLCPMNLGNYCPGCGAGDGNQSCAIAKCSQQHGGIEYCYLCEEYPCSKYDNTDVYDSFITHRNQLKDFAKVKIIGLSTYQFELVEKIDILKYLLINFNDGRRKNFYCIAVNLLELKDLKYVVQQITTKTECETLTLKEKATSAVNQLQDMAKQRNIVLKLNKKAK